MQPARGQGIRIDLQAAFGQAVRYQRLPFLRRQPRRRLRRLVGSDGLGRLVQIADGALDLFVGPGLIARGIGQQGGWPAVGQAPGRRGGILRGALGAEPGRAEGLLRLGAGGQACGRQRQRARHGGQARTRFVGTCPGSAGSGGTYAFVHLCLSLG